MLVNDEAILPLVRNLFRPRAGLMFCSRSLRVLVLAFFLLVVKPH
jgi:hypothetical protein